jgi:hypothetical protein
MWFQQYGRLWSGPWFLLGADTVLVYVAGTMYLIDLPTSLLTTGDRGGVLACADR